MPEQKIISIDATTLNTLQNCALKLKLAFIDNLQPNEKAEALESGDLMHKLLEPWYGLKYGCARFDSDTWKTLLEAGLMPDVIYDHDHENEVVRENLINFCVQVGQFWATKMDAPPEELEEVIYQFKEYVDFYKNEDWHPLAVEEVGSRILFEDSEWKIIYNCKTDLVAERGSLIVPWDHKTGKRRAVPSSLGNQWIGTCFVLQTNRIMLNKIGFQKSLKPQERFQRFLMEVQDSRIEEWMIDTIYWAKLLHWYIENDYWPMNRTSCDKYSGCIYKTLHEKAPDQRLYVIERDFHIGDKWDVAKILEATE